MPLFSGTASAIKSRFGFHDHTSSEMKTVKSTPDLEFKSAAKALSVVRSFSGFDDDGDDTKPTPPLRGFEFHEDPNFWKEHSVQVIIRLRPLSNSEISLQGTSRCVRQDSSQTITWTGHPESRFTFDVVADESVTQEMLFKVAGVPMVENCMGGYNSCMFAYGQTGSGKTHTMLGDIEGGTRRHSVNCGMTPRVFEYLFSRIQKEREARREEKIRFICRCSFLEIYNEQILDLLDPSSMNLQIREDNKKGIYVENLTEVEVTSARDVIQQLLQGAANRKVAATNMNHASSRSHSVFTCTLESKWESQGVTHHRFARLNLVDLAGSERQKSSGAEGERLKEATNINKSLSTLGLVIMNLVNMSNGKSLHVPYRDSKLTFLLQDSLGGNAKTSIIANISPSSCCSLETLSTLKFAQRAKYIKNHAIVNEDASGDVLAMRVQIQNLKKEVSRLRSLLANGGAENNDIDTVAASFPDSPGSFKWEGLQGLSTLFTSTKKMSHKKEYEVALVGAYRREKEKDTALQAMSAETQAAMKLAKQREDEIKSLTMRLRFREEGIKRLEAVASGKISAETHLLKEKEEHLKEIEVLRTQVDRNQEVTRFAMENLRLKEEIRRLKSFCEEGERERMNEQISMLQNKLLEALDWKLMHETDPVNVQKEFSELANLGDDLLLSSQDSASPWRTSMNEENEFLRMQAIQNQSELDSLRKKLNSCAEEREILQRHVNDLLTQLEAEKAFTAANAEEAKETQLGLPSLSNNQIPSTAPTDQVELKAIVDAIAVASQREAKAHETAICLSKENDELKMKLKVMIEDNNKLIELYEGAVAENHDDGCGTQDKDHKTVETSDHWKLQKKDPSEMINEVKDLKHQLLEMHEENEKLMNLYEIAMTEKDELKRLIASNEQRHNEIRVEIISDKKFTEIDRIPLSDEAIRPAGEIYTEGPSESCREDGDAVNDIPVEASLYELNVENGYCEVCVCPQPDEDYPCLIGVAAESEVSGKSSLSGVCPGVMNEWKASEGDLPSTEACSPEPQEGHFHSKPSDAAAAIFSSEDMSFLQQKLVEAQEKLSESAQVMTVFASLERTILEVDELSKAIERIELGLEVKQEVYASSNVLYTEMLEKRVILDRKLAALRYSLMNFSSSLEYFEQREAQARERVNASSAYLNQKREELFRLQSCKDKILAAQMSMKQSEVELKSEVAQLKLKEDEESRRVENDRVLFAIENVEQTDARASQKDWHLTGKASELLKSEEQKIKLQYQMKQSLEKLGATKKEVEDMNKKLRKVDMDIEVVLKKIESASPSVEEVNHKLQSIIKEKEMILGMKENGKDEFGTMILDLHQCIFETGLKEEEMRVLEEELHAETVKVEGLRRAVAEALGRKSNLLEEISCHSCLVSDKIEENLHKITESVAELNSLL